MKKCFTHLFFTFGLISLFHSNAVAQDLVKPVPNVSVKQSKVVLTQEETSTIGPDGIKKTKNGNVINPSQNNLDENPSNATRDQSNYQARKSEWIKNNPEKYKAVSGNPNLVIMTEAELLLLSSEEQNRILADEENYLIIR